MYHFNIFYLTIFIPVVIILGGLFRKIRKYIFLAASLFLFYTISGKLLLYVVASAFSIRYLGLWIKKIQNERDIKLEQIKKEDKKDVRDLYTKKQRKVVFLSVVLHIGLLFILKYSGFVLGNINNLLSNLNISFRFYVPKLLLPIGISFFTLEAVSYIVDIYHEKIEPEKSFLKLTLFLSFFAYLIEGPIVKYDEVSENLFSSEPLKYKNITFGLQRILFGVFKKIIIADRLNILIKTVFNGYHFLSGSIIFFAAICYTIQLYAEFSGTMDVALGTAEIFGIKLPENFHNPFFSKNITKFWQRWHITLGRWFKDYIFYPVSLSKPIKKFTLWSRKHIGYYYGPVIAGSIALFLVWLSNGLWHGAKWKYIFFGLYHFVLILIGSLLTPLIKQICQKLKINTNSKFYKFGQILKTFILVVIGELFFRADNLTAGFEMFKLIITDFNINALFNGSLLTLGVDICDYIIVFVALIVVFIVSLLREREINVRESIAKKSLIIRWIIYYLLIISIVVFGAYGGKYVPVEPIYAEF